MKTASIRELKNRTSAIVRDAAKGGVVITSRGRPVACLMGIVERERNARNGAVMSKDAKDKLFRLLARLSKIKPDKGKKWVPAADHDRVLYGEPFE